MTTFGGGWIVIQRRFDMSVDFNRNWEEYENGFGQIDGGEFWIGNEYLHQLSQGKTNMELLVWVEDRNGESRFGWYKNFFISGEDDFYRLSDDLALVDGLGGLEGHKGIQFSAGGIDRDTHASVSCSDLFRGGWWFTSCASSIVLNGNDLNPSYAYYGMSWWTWNHRKDKCRSEMMIKFTA